MLIFIILNNNFIIFGDIKTHKHMIPDFHNYSSLFFSAHLYSECEFHPSLKDVIFHSITNELKPIFTADILSQYDKKIIKINDFVLVRKDLSSLTKEDACFIAMKLVSWQDSMQKLNPENIKIRSRQDGDHAWDKIIIEFSGSFKYTVRFRGNDFMGWIESNGRCEWNLFNHSEVYDYLRLKGYALPFMGISVENQIKYGWIKINDK